MPTARRRADYWPSPGESRGGFAHENIYAYAVAPSWVATDLSADAVDLQAIAAQPMREPVPPQDVAETIVFLASGRARHATGATVDITGADYVR